MCVNTGETEPSVDLNFLEETIKSAEEEIQISLQSVGDSLATMALEMAGQNLAGGNPVANTLCEQ